MGIFLIVALIGASLWRYRRQPPASSPRALGFNWKLGRHSIDESLPLQKLRAVALRHQDASFHLEALFSDGRQIHVGAWKESRIPAELARQWSEKYQAQVCWGELPQPERSGRWFTRRAA